MSDAHVPSLADFKLSDEEDAAVTLALAQKHPWNHMCKELKDVRDHLISAKDKLADFHMERQKDACCYCRSILAGMGPYQRDREHILPKKDKFSQLAYDPANLSVSCKRCNMEYKRERTDFVEDVDTILPDYKNSERYRIVHPNFDRWEDYLERIVMQSRTGILVTYVFDPAVPKAAFTYDFFGLNELEINSFDECQGLHSVRQIIEIIDMEIPDRI